MTARTVFVGLVGLALAGPMVLLGCGPRFGNDGGPGVDSGAPGDMGTPNKMCGLTGQDSDGDGLPDAVEDTNGNGITDPGECDWLDADTDGDGLTDTVEVGCDALYKPGIDTRCDDADSDGDGLTDGFEDANGNGVYEPGLGETDPINADSDMDGCTDGEEFVMMTNPNNPDSDGDSIPDGFEDANCDGVVDPNEGETDPNLTDTDGDGTPDYLEPTFICNPATKLTAGGLRPVDFFESDQGDWRVAVEASSMAENRTVTYTDLAVAGVGVVGMDVRAGATFDYVELPASGSMVEVAGFIMSIPLDANGDGAIDPSMNDHIEVRDRISGLINTVFGPMGGTTTRSAGTAIVSWEGAFDAVVSTTVEVTVAAGSNVGGVRNLLFPTVMGLPQSAFTNLPPAFGATGTSFVIVFETLWRAAPNAMTGFPGRAVLMGAVAATMPYDDATGLTPIRVGDLANGTGLAQYGDGDDIECDPFELIELPQADIVWVIDDSGSTNSYRTSIKDNAVDLFTRAVGAGLDFRMGVTSMGPNVLPSGFICDPPIGATSPPTGVSCSSATPPPSSTYNPQSIEGRWILPSEQNAFGWCICHPPNGDGGTEYGLENGRAATLNHLPRDATDPTKIRPGSTLVVIHMGDETAQGSGYSLSSADTVVGSSGWNLHIQPFIDLWNGVANPANIYPAGAAPIDSLARVHGIVRITPGCTSNAAFGYEQVVNAIGGVLGSVCAGNLGPTMQVIIDDIIGSASPVILDRTPISLSLACALNDTVIDRSRILGFDYNPSANSVVFYGLGMMLEMADVACSYRYPIDDTPFEEGPGGGPPIG